MPDDDPMVRRDRLEAPVQARHRLRRQRHLGHQIDDAATSRQHACHGVKVDLGLARTGNPVQQVGGKDAAIQARSHGAHDCGLLLVQNGRQRRHHFAVSPIVREALAPFQPKPEPKPEVKVEPKTETKDEGEGKAEAKPKPEAKAEPKPEVKAETKPKVESKPETQAEVKPTAKAAPKEKP